MTLATMIDPRVYKTFLAAAMAAAQALSLSGNAGKAAPLPQPMLIQPPAVVEQAEAPSLHGQLAEALDRETGGQAGVLTLRDGAPIQICGTAGISRLG